ncbi:MAG: late competence development ComFB family protein [Spirochaetes bacterium]|nr:late competence development ComFB family protein [Spirochaetota bacterium]
MAIRNIMEDVVASVVYEVLSKEKKVEYIEVYFDDIVAYVLNRIPPRYVTSERGILHDRIDFSRSAQRRSDILFLVHEAMRFVQSRRSTPSPPSRIDESAKMKFFPHVLGEVLEETTFNPISGIEISLLYNNQHAQMIDPNWPNPYKTNKATKGFFHFWPKFIEGEMDEFSPIEFVLRFSHPALEELETRFSLKAVTSFNLGNSHVLPITLMKTKEGVDASTVFDCE